MCASLAVFGGRWSQGRLAAGNGRNKQNAVAFPQRTGFATEKADVLFIEINVQELADLPAFVAHVAGQFGELLGKRIQRLGNRGRATVHFRGAIGEAPESRGNFNRNWHRWQNLLLQNEMNL